MKMGGPELAIAGIVVGDRHYGEKLVASMVIADGCAPVAEVGRRIVVLAIGVAVPKFHVGTLVRGDTVFVLYGSPQNNFLTRSAGYEQVGTEWSAGSVKRAKNVGGSLAVTGVTLSVEMDKTGSANRYGAQGGVLKKGSALHKMKSKGSKT
ncbi:hypothetical protein GCM10023189_24090 [Nibrella saemangeumensis]|uniref:Uncharacterized protein n=1 Tax=Nibrella saemangeumensis TaxID=1084526 RepID=A0ABP8MTF2_9BACT